MGGNSVTAAFGFGSTTGSAEETHSLVYLETEGAVVLTFQTDSPRCLYVAKVTMATGG